MEAGKLLENLPDLWEEADLAERRKLLMAMLDAVYAVSYTHLTLPTNREV